MVLLHFDGRCFGTAHHTGEFSAPAIGEDGMRCGEEDTFFSAVL